MGMFLAVGQGSDNPPRMIVMRSGAEGQKDALGRHLAIIGKGVCFDSGGISIKPGDRMEEMKMDKTGAATVIAAIETVARLAPGTPLLAVAPAVENMPGSHSTRPGDIVKALNGKVVEINNTDAEGRLILGDAMTYAERLGATHMVDVATLTGAVGRALGELVTGLFGTPQDWVEQVQAAAGRAGERMWQIPLVDEYMAEMDSWYADFQNSSTSSEGGLVKSGLFLREFATIPWVHLDIGGTGYFRKAQAVRGPRLERRDPRHARRAGPGRSHGPGVTGPLAASRYGRDEPARRRPRRRRRDLGRRRRPDRDALAGARRARAARPGVRRAGGRWSTARSGRSRSGALPIRFDDPAQLALFVAWFARPDAAPRDRPRPAAPARASSRCRSSSSRSSRRSRASTRSSTTRSGSPAPSRSPSSCPLGMCAHLDPVRRRRGRARATSSSSSASACSRGSSGRSPASSSARSSAGSSSSGSCVARRVDPPDVHPVRPVPHRRGVLGRARPVRLTRRRGGAGDAERRRGRAVSPARSTGPVDRGSMPPNRSRPGAVPASGRRITSQRSRHPRREARQRSLLAVTTPT